jgi:hypothetical protein
MGVLGTFFGGAYIATSGPSKAAKATQTPPINASSPDEENFIKCAAPSERVRCTGTDQLPRQELPRPSGQGRKGEALEYPRAGCMSVELMSWPESSLSCTCVDAVPSNQRERIRTTHPNSIRREESLIAILRGAVRGEKSHELLTFRPARACFPRYFAFKPDQLPHLLSITRPLVGNFRIRTPRMSLTESPSACSRAVSQPPRLLPRDSSHHESC